MSDVSNRMTEGRPLNVIIKFALPVILGNVFQQLYTVSDTAIVSNGVGIYALAALGVTDWMNWLMIGGITGLTQGFLVVVSQSFGSKDMEGLRKSVAMIVKCAAVSALVITVSMLALLDRMLQLLNVLPDIFPMAHAYSQILFMGSAATMLYNTEAAILRAIGDSRTPLKSVIVSSLLNILMDLLFVYRLGWGIKGAAWATVISQLCSGIYCFCVLRKQTFLVPKRCEWKTDWHLVKEIMTMSLPIVVEDVVIAVSGMIVQSVVNVCGTAFVAGFSAVNKLYGALNIIASSLGAAVAAFSGQNYGAGNIRRVKKGNKDTMLVAVLSSLVISVGLFVFQRSIIGFFISDEETLAANAIDGAVFYLQRFAIFLWVLYAAAVLRATLQGIGYTKSIMVSGVVGFLARSIIAIFLPQRYGIYVLYYDEVSGWASEAVILAAVYIIWLKNTKKRGEENGIKIT